MYVNGNTDGTPITQLRNDIPDKKKFNDDESNYSLDSIKTSTDLRQMIDNINNDIESSKKQESIKKASDDDTIEKEEKEEQKKKRKKDKKKKSKETLEDYIYDFILLYIIFMLMSQQFVKNFIGTYIKSININETGVVPFKGIAIYGVIFVSIFILSKLLINKIVEL
jgi:cation transport ATPase